MCGRYALGIRASFVRYQLQQQGMQVDDAPADDVARETYNFPPGSYGLVYRADVPDSGLRDDNAQPTNSQAEDETNPNTDATSNANDETNAQDEISYNSNVNKPIQYHLKAMKWGLIPFWTKRSPDYSSMLRTINCRDDSLLTPTGLWNTMKARKRCLVIAQGFYEWLKKGSNQKVPHFVKRADGQLMLMAGLWDCVKYEDAEDKLYTYTVITTDANKQLRFLHDRMPVILDPGSEQLEMWLDPRRNKWSDELQKILKPYEGELECYPVSQEVGKVGNNSATFIVPVDSRENKKNIANFFDNAKKQSPKKQKVAVVGDGKGEGGNAGNEDGEDRVTKDHDTSENHAPMPEPSEAEGGKKRKLEMHDEAHEQKSPPSKAVKVEQSSPSKSTAKVEQSSPAKPEQTTPFKPTPNTPDPQHTSPTKQPAKKSRSATSNQGNTLSKKSSPLKSAAAGSQRITNFFGKTDPG